MAKKKVVKSPKTHLVPLKYNVPDNIITRFATNVVVQISNHEFKISFFEQKTPIHINTPPPKEIQADCVASVIVTADRLPGVIKLLQNQLVQYNNNKPEK